MARYYFHLHDGAFVSDNEGLELEEIAAAKDVAVQTLAEALKGRSDLVLDTERLRVIVTDASCATLFSIEMTVTMSTASRRGGLPH